MKVREAIPHGAQLAWGELPRLAFGNSATLTHNVSSRRRLQQLRRDHPRRPVDPASLVAADQLWRDGHLIRPPSADPALVRRVIAGYEAAIDDPERSRDLTELGSEAKRFVMHPEQAVAGVTELLDGTMRDVVTAYFRCPFRLLHVRLWRINHFGPEWEHDDVFGNLWHTDDHPVHNVVKAFVQLSDDVSETGAALRVHSAAHTRKVMRRGFLYPKMVLGPAASMLDDPDEVVVFDQPPGSVFYCATTRSLHRAGNPAPGRSRAMLQFSFYADPDGNPDDLFAALKPDLSVVGPPDQLGKVFIN